jgi:membrane protein DedA with SNARE-associated domain
MNSYIVTLQSWLAKMGGGTSAIVSGFGSLGVVLLAIADSSFFSAPEANDLLIVILSAGKSWSNMAFFVGLTVMGSVLGCFILYTVGRKGGNPILRSKFSQAKIERAEKLFDRYGVLAVIIPSILPPPVPFKIFVLGAGVFRLNMWAFLISVVIGRTIRYSVWGILAVLYGNAVKQYMQQNLNMMGTIIFIGIAFALIFTFAIYLYRPKAGGSGKAS